jgi:hypothetical protein
MGTPRGQLMPKTEEELYQEITSLNAASARLAVDYLDGDQLPHFEEYLDTSGKGIKDWRKRGVLPLWENITGLVIDRSAQTYQNEPDRIVINQDGTENEQGTEAYNQLLEDSNADEVFEDADILSRLLKTAIVIGQYSEDRGGVYFSAVSRHNADCDYVRATRKMNSLLYSGGGFGPDGGELFHYWDGSRVLDFEKTGVNGGLKPVLRPDSRHSYKIVPAAVLFDVRPPRAGFWSKPVWQQLINFNNGINLFHTETKYNERFGAMGALFTNMKIKEGQTIGPDAVVQVDSVQGVETPFLEYRSPTLNLEQFQAWLDAYRENIGQEWGVNIKTAGEGSADSGFKLVVEELPGLQLRKKRQKPADTFEQDLYQVCLALSRVHNLGLVENTKLKVTFPKPDLPVNEKEKAEVRNMELATGIKTLEDIWKEDDPSLTAEDIEARKAARKTAVPDFTGVINAE